MSYSKRVRSVALRLGPVLGVISRPLLRDPVFLVGFNKSGKSTLVEGLAQQPGVAIFPGEGNESLWFRGFYPWSELQVDVPPLWFDPNVFVGAVTASRTDRFLESRAQLGLYQALRAPSGIVVVDSGMLAALLPDLAYAFPDAKVIHMVRDGRVVSHMSVRKTMARIAERPERYRFAGCSTDAAAITEAQARLWCWTLDRVAAAESLRPGSTLQVRYEDWCEDPDGILRQIASFAGVGEDRFCTPRWNVRIRNQNLDVLSEISDVDLTRIERVQADHLSRYGYVLTSSAGC